MKNIISSNRLRHLLPGLLILALLSGLLASTTLQQYRISPSNGMTLNGMTFNGLTFNGLRDTGLAGSALNSRSPTVRAFAASAENLELLRVMTKCALGADEQLQLNTVNGQYDFPGMLGLAREWSKTALSISGQRWVSACILAHVNNLGEHIALSLRGANSALTPSISEQGDFTVEEGAFWGNLFISNPVLASCVGDHVSSTSQSDLAKRLCATDINDGSTSCGFETAGACSNACDDFGNTLGYSSCQIEQSKGETIREVITVYLRGGAPG